MIPAYSCETRFSATELWFCTLWRYHVIFSFIKCAHVLFLFFTVLYWRKGGGGGDLEIRSTKVQQCTATHLTGWSNWLFEAAKLEKQHGTCVSEASLALREKKNGSIICLIRYASNRNEWMISARGYQTVLYFLLYCIYFIQAPFDLCLVKLFFVTRQTSKWTSLLKRTK